MHTVETGVKYILRNNTAEDDRSSSAPQGSKPIMNSMKTIVPTTNT